MTAQAAVLVGTAAYAHFDPVPAAANSLQLMRDVLTGPLCGWRDDQVTVLADEAMPGDIPARLVEAFEAVTDLALFYFVGHGQPDSDDHLCLALTQTRREPSRRRVTSLDFDAVRHALRESRARFKVIILDCCFSGLAVYSAGTLGPPDQEIDKRVRGTGACVVAACGPYTSAWYENEPGNPRPYTHFTKRLAEIVREGPFGDDGVLTLGHLTEQLTESLAAAGKPVPVALSRDQASKLEFARYDRSGQSAAAGSIQGLPERTTPPTDHPSLIRYDADGMRLPASALRAGPLVPGVPSHHDGPSRGPGTATEGQVGPGSYPVNPYSFSPTAAGRDGIPLMPTSGTADPPHRGHAFISYVREDSSEVDRLQRMLEAAGIPVWRDTSSLWPGEDWRAKVRGAISRDALVFIVCLSSHSATRRQSYMNEELLLAIDQLRLRRPQDPWLIPVRFDDCDVPDLELGAGRTLSSIQRVDLFGASRDLAAERLVLAVQRLLQQQRLAGPSAQEPGSPSGARRRQPAAEPRATRDRSKPITHDLPGDLLHNADAPWNLFSSDDYWRGNYHQLQPEDREIIRRVSNFFVHTFAGRPSARQGIDVGSGTNLYPALLMLPWTEQILLTDFSASNVRWLRSQLADDGPEWTWLPFWRELQGADGYNQLSEPREQLRDACVSKPGYAGIEQLSVFDLPAERWDLGTMFFVAESITEDPREFHTAVERFVRALRPGAPFAAAFMAGSHGYPVGSTSFPALSIAPDDVRQHFTELCAGELSVELLQTKHRVRDGYAGMMVATGFAGDH